MSNIINVIALGKSIQIDLTDKTTSRGLLQLVSFNIADEELEWTF